ncbi:MAG: PBP1A family penicillin-binding protein [Candidatus Latescibacterota bacterium]|nr:MAG: PBP1A family penicillin-binding protein [Candidatus Latescibacterota bacterium]
MKSRGQQIRVWLGRNAPRLVRLTLVTTLAALALGAGMLWATYRTLGSDLPSLTALEDARPVGGTLVLSAAGDTLHSFYREKRVNVRLDDVPDELKVAVLSVEDWRFYSHWGIDLWSLARAILANLRHGWGEQGASTLTQQLARNLILESHEQTLTRKVREAMLTLRIERTYTKDEIFRMYLNEIYFGEGAHGIEAAARTYFGKSVRDLTLVESATLAGLPKNPSNYSPLRNPERAVQRRNLVLRTMRDHGLVASADFDSLVQTPLETRPPGSDDPVGAYFVEEVRKYLEAEYGVDELYSGELRVYTTLDLELQRSAEAAVEARIRELERTRQLPFARDTLASVSEEEPQYLQGAAVALDPRTGRILAMVGGRSFSESRFNRAVQARRQPGSCFKPIVYTAAIQAGSRPSDIILDTPLVMEMGGGRGLWKPQNYEKTFNGPVSLRYALARSLNIPAIKLQAQIGTEKVMQAAHRMGIRSRLEPVLSLALGTSETTLLELTSAFATLANGGIYSRPWYIEKIEDRFGKVLERAQPYHEEALSPQVAYIVTHMLQSVVDWGTGRNARVLYGLTIPAAGKTGTTDDTADGWFVGFTPDLVVGVWGGYDERRSIGLPGALIGLPPWADIMRGHYATRTAQAFNEPGGILSESVCTDSGKLATPHCPNVQSELFTKQSRPRRECDLHTLRALDYESDGAFTGFEDTEPRAPQPRDRPPG